MELVGNVSHVYIEPVSKIEFSAKDIRSRINSSFEESDLSSSFVTVASPQSGANSFVTVNSPDSRPQSMLTRYHSVLEDIEDESKNNSFEDERVLDVVVTLFMDGLEDICS